MAVVPDEVLQPVREGRQTLCGLEISCVDRKRQLVEEGDVFVGHAVL